MKRDFLFFISSPLNQILALSKLMVDEEIVRLFIDGRAGADSLAEAGEVECWETAEMTGWEDPERKINKSFF